MKLWSRYLSIASFFGCISRCGPVRTIIICRLITIRHYASLLLMGRYWCKLWQWCGFCILLRYILRRIGYRGELPLKDSPLLEGRSQQDPRKGLELFSYYPHIFFLTSLNLNCFIDIFQKFARLFHIYF